MEELRLDFEIRGSSERGVSGFALVSIVVKELAGLLKSRPAVDDDQSSES